MKKVILFVAAVALLFSCSTTKLARKLPKDIRDWYGLHSPLMLTKVPTWIVEEKRSERYCFLRLPEDMQRMYMANFWKVRREGLDEVFYSRVEEANWLCRDESRIGWKTDMGRVILLCGIPTHIRWYCEGRVTMQPGMSTDIGYTQVWIYWTRMGYVIYTWEKTGGHTWRQAQDIHSNQMYYEGRCRDLFAPTTNGWDMIGDWVYMWMEENK